MEPTIHASTADLPMWLPTATFGRQLLVVLDTLREPALVDDRPHAALRCGEQDPQARCDLCPRDCTWFRAEGRPRTRRRDGEQAVLCFSCVQKGLILKHIKPGAPVSFFCSSTAAELARAMDNATLVIHRASGVADLLPVIDHAPVPAPLGTSPDLDLELEEAVDRFGTPLPAIAIDSFATKRTCRAHVRDGVGLVVRGAPDEVEEWRWSRDREDRGSCWDESPVDGEPPVGSLRVGLGAERRLEHGVSLDAAYERISTGDVVQLIDFPTNLELELTDVLPNAQASYHTLVPDPEMMNMQHGHLNLDADLYPISERGITGPFLYSGAADTYTALHLDSSSAMNVAVSIIPASTLPPLEPGEPVALWVIFERQYAGRMAECLAKRPVGMGSDVQILSQLDTLYSHRRTIDSTDVSNLVNNGIPVSYAYQGLGDRVIIPAGCPHFVLNLYACAKLAADFISPSEVDAVRVVEEQRAAHYQRDPDPEEHVHADIARLPANVLSALARLGI